MVLKHGDELVAVAVDAIVGDEEIVVKNLSEEFATVEGISGATILGDGRIGLIIDVANLVTRGR